MKVIDLICDSSAVTTVFTLYLQTRTWILNNKIIDTRSTFDSDPCASTLGLPAVEYVGWVFCLLLHLTLYHLAAVFTQLVHLFLLICHNVCVKTTSPEALWWPTTLCCPRRPPPFSPGPQCGWYRAWSYPPSWVSLWAASLIPAGVPCSEYSEVNRAKCQTETRLTWPGWMIGVVRRPELRETKDRSDSPATSVSAGMRPDTMWGSQVNRKTEQVVNKIHL